LDVAQLLRSDVPVASYPLAGPLATFPWRAKPFIAIAMAMKVLPRQVRKRASELVFRSVVPRAAGRPVSSQAEYRINE